MKKILFIIILISSYQVLAQKNEPVTITVSGTGQTKEIAQKNALRNALEQAFGTFLSSKTEILNDSLVREEIVTVTNGNIIDYKVIAELEIPNSGWATTLSATVSVSKLTSYFESKGVEIEFKGNSFATNIKLQKLNEQAEYKVIYNLLSLGVFMLAKSVDFEISSGEPKFTGENDLYNVEIKVDYKTNENRESFLTYFENTISKLAMSESEVNTYKSNGKPIYEIEINNGKTLGLYRLRNAQSMILIEGTFCVANALLIDFGIYSEADTLFVDVTNRNIASKPRTSAYNNYWYSLPHEDNCDHIDGIRSYKNLPIINFCRKDYKNNCSLRFYTMYTFLESITGSIYKTYTGGTRMNGQYDNLEPLSIDYAYKPVGSWLINHRLSLKQMEKISKYKIVKHSPEFKQSIKNNRNNDTWLKGLYGIQ